MRDRIVQPDARQTAGCPDSGALHTRESSQQTEILRSLEACVKARLDLLKDPLTHWQPDDFLPRASEKDKIAALQEEARRIPDSVLVVLVGNAVTEEGLPLFVSRLNTIDPIRDSSGTDHTAWAEWIRGWTAEENRHGDILSLYLYLCDRIDNRAYQTTIQLYNRNGFNPNVYVPGNGVSTLANGLVYACVQELATKVSHANVARLSKESGNETLARICGKISGDEHRHAQFYREVLGRMLALDPENTVIAVRDMVLGHKVVMPAALMDDIGRVTSADRESELFGKFSHVACEIGVYTAKDYVDIVSFLLREWGIEKLEVNSPEAREAQDQLGRFTPEYGMKLERIVARRYRDRPNPKFSWIWNREVGLR